MDTMLEIAKRVDAFMMERSPVHDTMRRLAKAFSDLEIAFAIAGAMAANAHGHRRTTADVIGSSIDFVRYSLTAMPEVPTNEPCARAHRGRKVGVDTSRP